MTIRRRRAGGRPVRKALLVIPVPCDARAFANLLMQVASRWERDHPGKRMTMDHLETRESVFGDVVVVWDRPLDGEVVAGG
jgi:hypothetical protein